MTAEVYTGTVSGMRTSPWLASEDLDGLGEVPVVIEAVYKHGDVTMQDGRKLKVMFALKFAGKDKEMVVNATNRKTLAAAFGANVKAWKGKSVLLYVQDGVKNPAGGAPVKGLRIKIKPERKIDTRPDDVLGASDPGAPCDENGIPIQ